MIASVSSKMKPPSNDPDLRRVATVKIIKQFLKTSERRGVSNSLRGSKTIQSQELAKQFI